jgi:hypothetical protein
MEARPRAHSLLAAYLRLSVTLLRENLAAAAAALYEDARRELDEEQFAEFELLLGIWQARQQRRLRPAA